MEKRIGIILLAAGSSSRMGSSKQLLDIGGEPLLRRTAKIALSTKPSIAIVVLGSNKKEHRKVIEDLPVEIIYNPDWQKGMGNTLKAGLNQLLKIDRETEAVILLVCDQPLLTTRKIQELKEKSELTKAPIVACAYANTFGVPALFDKVMFQSLLSLPDDQGAKKVIEQNLSQVSVIPFPEGVVDIDRPEDYENFIKNVK